MLHDFIHGLNAIPLLLFVLVPLPFALLYYLRRQRTKPPTVIRALELGAYWFFFFLILLVLYIIVVTVMWSHSN